MANKAGAAPGYHFPALTGRVVDQADMLPAADEVAITAQSAALEKATGHQFVVVTVRSLDGRPIEGYARDLGNRWRIGRKGFNDGVLLLVAPVERKVRIAVGLGLETTLTDREAGTIIQGDILPAFKVGKMARGIRAGVDDVVRELSPPVRKAA